MDQKPTKTIKPSSPPSQLQALVLALIAAILIPVLTVILLVQGLPSTPAPEEETGQPGTVPTSPQTTPSLPVFSGGLIPTPPAVGANTVTLTEAISSQYAILINADTGEILAGKDFDTRFSPASMTKVMTLIVACEQLSLGDLDRMLSFDESIYSYITSGNYLGTSASLPVESNGLTCIGDRYRIEDLLYGIGVASAADCTYMIVKEVAGSEEAFVSMMNQKAAELGLSNTHFDNAVGFDSENNYTTAKEMAVIMAYAMQSERISAFLSQTTDRVIYAHYDKNGMDATYPVTLKCSWLSRLDKYPDYSLTGARMLVTKTGYTDQSFMVAGAESLSGTGRYVVVLGNRTSDATTISEKFKRTMVDMERLLNTYVQ